MNKNKLVMIALVLVFILSSCGINEIYEEYKNYEYEEEGGDWHTWRGYSEEMVIYDEFAVLFSDFSEGNGFGVYSNIDGSRIGSIIIDEETGYSFDDVSWPEVEDVDEDGINEIKVQANDGNILWYKYNADHGESWPDDVTGGFEFLYMEIAGSVSTENDLIDTLMNILGSKMEERILVETGEEIINESKCITYALGTDTSEKFTAEEHYAISESGEVYYMDIFQGGDWIPYK